MIAFGLQVPDKEAFRATALQPKFGTFQFSWWNTTVHLSESKVSIGYPCVGLPFKHTSSQNRQNSVFKNQLFGLELSEKKHLA